MCIRDRAYNHSPWNRAGYFVEKYFTPLGHKVFNISLDKTPYWSNWNQNLPVYLPKGFPVSVQSLEKKLKVRFDCVIELDGTGQFHLSGMKSSNIPTLLWSMDTHVRAKNLFQVYFQKDFSLILTCHKDYVGNFLKTRCEWLPVAADPDLHRPMKIPKIYDIAFVGNLNPQGYPNRVRYLEALSKKYRVGAFSNLFGDEMVTVLNQGKLVFNKSFNGDLNLRVFEALSMGACLLTDRVQNGLLDLFKDGKHLITYGDLPELEEKAAYYLSHDQERESIAQAGRAQVLAHHTYYTRAKEIMKFIENLEENK